jgi:hypothetical protein
LKSKAMRLEDLYIWPDEVIESLLAELATVDNAVCLDGVVAHGRMRVEEGATRLEELRPEWYAAQLAETGVARDTSAEFPAVEEVEKSTTLAVGVATSRGATTESRLPDEGVPSTLGGGPHLTLFQPPMRWTCRTGVVMGFARGKISFKSL